ncbi:hypothetical protein Lfu02_56690 [Longispora fulva]|uniref:Uncharacterized protein n=1 Tax=Longispora fulva TaxID=619741 RepID=A0A8J7GEP1_9ACTN|nr:DUF2142 domain-containing protein [Longispora fulva]MBG6137349.1 hypothetical protein [Longispora fulva]GIG61297.1 hypothetical protein Lfu02_56690 [Longispora fulva]
MNSSDPTARPGGRRLWLLAFVGFFLVIGAWAVAAPYDGPPDEPAHSVRAAGVAGGDVMPEPADAFAGTGAFQVVPKGIKGTLETGCWYHGQPDHSAACAAAPSADRELVSKPTSAGRYNPLYYAIVGGPLRLWPGWPGLILARLLSAALSAALLASAFTVLARWSRYGLMLGGLLAVTSPIVGHMSGAINPSGAEICAGIALFAAGIPLFLGPARGPVRPLVWLVGISAVLLVTVRSMGPMLAAIGLGVLLLPLGWRKVTTLWRTPLIRWWGLGIAVAVGLSGAWILVEKSSVLVPLRFATPLRPTQAMWAELSRWEQYLQQLVGVTGWLDTRVPGPFYAVWTCVAGGLVLVGFAFGARADRWRILALVAGGGGLLSAIQVINVNTYGFITQARYMMPLLVGVPLLGAFVIERRTASAEMARRLTRMIVVVLLPIHLVFLWYTMIRWQRGIKVNRPGIADLNPFGGAWTPPLGSVLPLVAMVVGLAVIGWLTWRGPARAAAVADLAEPGLGAEVPRPRAAAAAVGASR